MDFMKSITQEYEKTEIPAFNVGDTVKVHIKIKEGNRERIQVFEGFVLKRQNGGISETFTVRKISSGVGVEKAFTEDRKDRSDQKRRCKKSKTQLHA